MLRQYVGPTVFPLERECCHLGAQAAAFRIVFKKCRLHSNSEIFQFRKCEDPPEMTPGCVEQEEFNAY